MSHFLSCEFCQKTFTNAQSRLQHLNDFHNLKNVSATSSAPGPCKFHDVNTGAGCKNGKVCPFQHNRAPKSASKSAIIVSPSVVSSFGAMNLSKTAVNALSSLNQAARELRPNERIAVEYVTTSERKVMEMKRKPLQVFFLIDDSGSMAGSMFLEAIKGVLAVLKELSESDDWVAIATFSSKSHGTSLRQCFDFIPLKDGGKARVKSYVEELGRKGATGGGTALYDAMVEAAGKFKSYPSLPDLQHLLIVATDGEDSYRSLTPDQVNEHLHQTQQHRHLNLHVTILPIALSESLHSEFKKMLAGHPPLPGNIQRRKLGELHLCKDSTVVKDQFEKAFKTIIDTVKINYEVSGGGQAKTTMTTISSDKSGKAHKKL